MNYKDVYFFCPMKKGDGYMIKSMTGFGRCELLEHDKKINVEIKSVNHRYFDVSIKMPRKFNRFESHIRKIVQEYCSRGKIDVYISFEDLSEETCILNYNYELAKQYVEAVSEMAKAFSLAEDLTASQLSRYPDVIVMEEKELDEEEWFSFISKAVHGAAKQLVSAREKEGAQLLEDLSQKLLHMSELVTYIQERSPQIIEEYQSHLTEKVQSFLQESDIDENRILAEVTIFADKCCVDEELVRLRSHVDTTGQMLKTGGSIGRNLDFIVQEMNREANTILSKTSDLDIANRGIDLKTEIEKIREQIQNIE